YFVEKKQKLSALVHLLQETARSRTLVFSRTKWGADRIAKALNREGIKATAIHGNKSQNRRQAAIQEFKSEEPPVLVATDIAARGLDFDDISHVINFDLPDTSETYVHRIGRTARAGAKGAAISLCDSEERKRVRGIEQLTGCKIAVKNLPQFPQTSEPDDERRSRNGASSSWRGSASVNRTGGVRQGKKKSFTRPKKVGIHGETLRDESGDGAAVAKPAKKKTKHKSYQQKRAFNNGSDENNGGGSSNGATPTHKKRTFKKRTGGTTTPSLDDRNGSEKTAKKKPAQKNTIKKGSPTTGAPKKGSFKKSSKKPTGNGGGSTGNRPPGKRTERR
ncbi:MAG: ATP-dependent RNA helicase RhlE, partial [Pirellulaceae bacterium]